MPVEPRGSAARRRPDVAAPRMLGRVPMSLLARRTNVSLVLLGAACALAAGDLTWAAKTRTPVTSSAKNLHVSPQELRIRVRALIRPTLGGIEQAADNSLEGATDPKIKRGVLSWKIETTTTLLSAMLRNDPVLALADAWGYAIQVENRLSSPEVAAAYGRSAPEAAAAMAQVQTRFRAFAVSVTDEEATAALEAVVRRWAERNPIEGALYRRPSMDSAVADTIATSGGGGTFAALGSLEETTSDVMTRMDLYTMYLPRLGRWEAELAVDDLTRGADPGELAADFDRLARAADRLAAVFETAPGLIARERAAGLEAVRAERIAATQDLRGERGAVLDAVHQERVATLAELEAIADRIVDRSSGPFNEAVREDAKDILQNVEVMRKRLIDEAGVTLKGVVDHAFVRAIELLLVAAALGVLCLFLYARFFRRKLRAAER